MVKVVVDQIVGWNEKMMNSLNFQVSDKFQAISVILCRLVSSIIMPLNSGTPVPFFKEAIEALRFGEQ
jgi:hypothetical protein